MHTRNRFDHAHDDFPQDASKRLLRIKVSDIKMKRELTEAFHRLHTALGDAPEAENALDEWLTAAEEAYKTRGFLSQRDAHAELIEAMRDATFSVPVSTDYSDLSDDVPAEIEDVSRGVREILMEEKGHHRRQSFGIGGRRRHGRGGAQN